MGCHSYTNSRQYSIGASRKLLWIYSNGWNWEKLMLNCISSRMETKVISREKLEQEFLDLKNAFAVVSASE